MSSRDPGKLKELTQQLDVFPPCLQLVSRRGESIHGFDIYLVHICQGFSLTELSEVAQSPFVPAFGFIRIIFVMSLKSTDGISDHFPGFAGGAVLNLG